MKPTLQVFSFRPIEVKFHFHSDAKRFEKVLNENIDTLVGLNEEVFAEGFDSHEKAYKGVIRENLFEISSKHIIGVLRTYNPWTIRGDFQSVGSNVELTLSLKRSKSLREVLLLFAVFPLIALVILLSIEEKSATDFLLFSICIVAPICYHLSSRWIQFATLRHFYKLISKTIITSQIPN